MLTQDTIVSNRETSTIVKKQIELVRESSPFKALIYKSLALQRKSIATNICQILTPLLCVGFTLLVQILVTDRIISKIGYLSFPQPLNLPGLVEMLPQFNVTCDEFYFYNRSATVNQSDVDMLLSKVLSTYCPDIRLPAPYFQQHEIINPALMQEIKTADATTFRRGEDIHAHIPDGAVYFKTLNRQSFAATLWVNDHRLPEYHRSNGVTKLALASSNKSAILSYLRVTEGQMSIIDLLSKAYLKAYSPKEVLLSSFMYMPFNGEDRSLLNRIINVVGAGLYPLGLSFLLPVFIYAVVSEREQRLLEMMKINGLKILHYWVVMFGFNFALSVCTFGCFYIAGRFVFQLSYFVETSPVLLLVIMLGWAIAQISMANFVQVFMNKAKTATIIGYVIAIFTTLSGQAVAVAIFPVPMKMPWYLTSYPTFALCRLFYLMSFACSNGSCHESIYHIDDQMKWCIQVLYLSFILFPLSIYLNEVVKHDFGVSKHPLYFLKSLKDWCSPQQRQQNNMSNTIVSTSEWPLELEGQDQNVKEERNKVLSLQPGQSFGPLVIRQLHKKYEVSNGRADYTAVKPVSFRIRNNQIFGLLGPNGAGKTSLISVLTGLYPATSGDAWVDGFSVQSQIDYVRMVMGVCPQFDLLWKDLSPEQHLTFYARLKGVKEADLAQVIDQALGQVDLRAFRHHPSQKLSGGMKRRLSIAIALVGNPSIVFLDEPSSGLDPEHRRSLWDILIKCREKRSVMLTTHSMEEADVLCNRIAIITEGTLRCIGNQTELKLKYGSGYNLTFNLKKTADFKNLRQRMHRLRQFVDENIVTLGNPSEFNQKIVYKLSKSDNSISNIFRLFSQHKAALHVEDWALSQPSLYDVFIRVLNDDQPNQGEQLTEHDDEQEMCQLRTSL